MPAADVYFRPFVNDIKNRNRRPEPVFSQVPAASVPRTYMNSVLALGFSFDRNQACFKIRMVITEKFQGRRLNI